MCQLSVLPEHRQFRQWKDWKRVLLSAECPYSTQIRKET